MTLFRAYANAAGHRDRLLTRGARLPVLRHQHQGLALRREHPSASRGWLVRRHELHRFVIRDQRRLAVTGSPEVASNALPQHAGERGLHVGVDHLDRHADQPRCLIVFARQVCRLRGRSRELETFERNCGFGLRRRAPHVQHPESRLVQACALLVGQEVQRPVRRTPGVREPLVELASGDRVVCKLCEMWPQLLAIERLELFHDQPVRMDATHGGEPLVDGVSDEDVREAKVTRRAGNIRNHASGHRLIEYLEQLIFRHAGDTSERLECELLAEHRRDLEHAVALLGQVGESAGDDVADALRDGDPSSRARPQPLDREQAHRLADEERIPLGLLVQRLRELRRSELRGGQLDVLGDFLLAQPVE